MPYFWQYCKHAALVCAGAESHELQGYDPLDEALGVPEGALVVLALTGKSNALAGTLKLYDFAVRSVDAWGLVIIK